MKTDLVLGLIIVALLGMQSALASSPAGAVWTHVMSPELDFMPLPEGQVGDPVGNLTLFSLDFEKESPGPLKAFLREGPRNATQDFMVVQDGPNKVLGIRSTGPSLLNRNELIALGHRLQSFNLSMDIALLVTPPRPSSRPDLIVGLGSYERSSPWGWVGTAGPNLDLHTHLKQVSVGRWHHLVTVANTREGRALYIVDGSIVKVEDGLPRGEGLRYLSFQIPPTTSEDFLLDVLIDNITITTARHRLQPIIRPGYNRTGIGLMLDDARVTTYTNALPELSARGFVATAAIPTARVARGPNYMDWGQIRALYDAGWEMAAHGTNHTDLRKLPLGMAEAQIRDAKAFLEANVTGARVVTWVYPFNSHNATLDEYAYQYYDELRTGNVPNWDLLGDNLTALHPGDGRPFAYSLGAGYSYQGYIDVYSHWIREDAVAGDTNLDVFRSFLDDARNRSVMVSSVARLYPAYRNWMTAELNGTLSSFELKYPRPYKHDEVWLQVEAPGLLVGEGTYRFNGTKTDMLIGPGRHGTIGEVTTEVPLGLGLRRFSPQDGNTLVLMDITNLGLPAPVSFILEGFTADQDLQLLLNGRGISRVTVAGQGELRFQVSAGTGNATVEVRHAPNPPSFSPPEILAIGLAGGGALFIVLRRLSRRGDKNK